MMEENFNGAVKENNGKSKVKKALKGKEKEDNIIQTTHDKAEVSAIPKEYAMFSMRVLREKPESIITLPGDNGYRVKHKGIEWVDRNSKMEFFTESKDNDAIDFAINTAIQAALLKGWNSINIKSDNKDVLDRIEEQAKVVGLKVKSNVTAKNDADNTAPIESNDEECEADSVLRMI